MANQERWARVAEQNEKRDAEVVEMYAEGHGYNDIREKFKIGQSTIQRILRQAEAEGRVKIRPRGDNFSTARGQKFLEERRAKAKEVAALRQQADAILNHDRDEEIIRWYATGTATYKDIREKYQIGQDTVKKILMRGQEQGRLTIRRSQFAMSTGVS